ncbi:MAG: alcohol dehydrogenase catalytic domain-containing protein [Deltaproteobacteria bacterium]|nr:alcohol dehydrogenase catalytic domain-containing protein [Deltaproteobacteria bacterium]
MQALIFDGKLRLDKNHPVPERKPYEVLIRILKAGICRTDLEIVKGYLDFKGILGHEFVGIVEESPDQNLAGKRVVGEINISCGRCIYCLKGMATHCENRSALGIQNKNGVFAEYVSLPIENVHTIPDSVTDDQAVFVEPLAACLQITEQVHITPCKNVAVLGDGNLGLLCAQVLTATGTQVLAVGKHQAKLNTLKQRGIRTCLVGELSRERADFVVECTGSPSGLKEALQIVHPRGTIVLKSTYRGQARINLAPMVIDEITIIGSRCGPFRPAIRLLEKNTIDVLSLISERFPLGKAPQAIQAALGKQTIKVLIDISDR